MLKERFKELIISSIERDYSHIKARRLDIPLETDKIVCFIGVRRCGKTHLMFHAIQALRKKHKRENLVYLNFEDDRIFPLGLEGLSLFPEAYYELFPDKKNEKVYFFFDEIQNVANWEKFIRRLYDTENCRIFLSGSSSSLLSSEIASSLRGRSLSIEVFPLSFGEFLDFKDIDPNIYSAAAKPQIMHAFQEYLEYGGFPELPFMDEQYKRPNLQEYIDLIIYRDLIERYGVSNNYLLKYLVKYCYTNIATLLSLNKLFNDFKSQGLQLSKNTLYNYMGHLEDAYAVFSLPKMSKSLAEQRKNPQKIYSVDVGFKAAVSHELDYGHRFENIVFLHLRRLYPEIFYWKGKQEIDFAFYKNGALKLVNVAYDLSDPKTMSREISGLSEGMKEHGLKESVLINSEMERLVEVDVNKIYIFPLYKWLLQ